MRASAVNCDQLPAHRKLEQVHRSFMDEKDRIITAIYNETRARARSVPVLLGPLAACPGTSLQGLPLRGYHLQGQQSQAAAGATAEAAVNILWTFPRPWDRARQTLRAPLVCPPDSVMRAIKSFSELEFGPLLWAQRPLPGFCTG